MSLPSTPSLSLPSNPIYRDTLLQCFSNLSFNQRSGSTNQQKSAKTFGPSIHVGNLPKESFYDLDLYKVFSCKGYPVVSSKVVLDRKTSKGMGHGYVTFSK
jgi:RNA recognition motif-containing protein